MPVVIRSGCRAKRALHGVQFFLFFLSFFDYHHPSSLSLSLSSSSSSTCLASGGKWKKKNEEGRRTQHDSLLLNQSHSHTHTHAQKNRFSLFLGHGCLLTAFFFSLSLHQIGKEQQKASKHLKNQIK